MRNGSTLAELSAEIMRVRDTKRDFIADTSKIRVDTVNGKPQLALEGVPTEFGLTRLATTQLAEHTGVPIRFFDRLAENYPACLDFTVNSILREEHKPRMIRTLDGNARAWLSNSYRALDNDIAAETVLPMLLARGAKVVSCELTPTKLYIKALFGDRQTTVKVGDFVQSGVVFSNSEVGGGAFSLQPLIYRLACLNGMILNDNRLRAIHLGSKDAESDVREYYATDTKNAIDAAFLLRVRDTLTLMGSDEFLEKLVQPMRDSVDQPITKSITDVMEVTAKKFSMTNPEKDGVLMALASGGDMTRFGLANALTRYSQDVQDYDRATEFERIGGQVIEMPRREWNSIALAA